MEVSSRALLTAVSVIRAAAAPTDYIMHFHTVLAFICAVSCGGSTTIRRRDVRSDDSDWSYDGENGPENWPGLCQSGKRQSPIDIGGHQKKLKGKPLAFDGAYSKPVTWLAAWNGHSYTASFQNMSHIAILGEGSLDDDYVFQSLHLHWGSEHTIDDERYTAEMHLVHYNSKYSADEAASQPDGLAVVGILLEEQDGLHNSTMSDFLEAITAEDVEDQKPIRQVSLRSLLPEKVAPWVRYRGSLTTPPCSENVRWTVIFKPVPIRKGLAKNVKRHTDDSHRPVQPLNKRDLYIYLQDNGNEAENANEVSPGGAGGGGATIHFISTPLNLIGLFTLLLLTL